MKKNKNLLCCLIFGMMLAGLAVTGDSFAQYENTWMNVGSLHNWYSEIGCEREHGFVSFQQYGMRWPAIYEYQDMQAMKGMWFGVKNFTDEKGSHFPYKVVHVGPRTTGAGEFFPVRFEMVSKYDESFIAVDGNPTFREFVDIHTIDPDMEPDRMLINIVNSAIGLTMERRIMQFSHPYHDNYHIIEYTFTNTGNTNADSHIELPDQTLEDIYFFFTYRWAVCRETRYVIGNGTGWGLNTMLDTRGDGVMPDPPGEDFRAQFAWHGNFSPFTTYDNIGGPIWDPGTSSGYVGAADSLGRLGAAQFVGVATLHADKSAADRSDNTEQPSTTGFIHSDHPIMMTNNHFDNAQMEEEYNWMSRGRMSPRHAWLVEPDGDFAKPNSNGDPSLGTSGGLSAANGYGPYTLGPGESVRLVLVEAAAGLSREQCIEIGRQFKQGTMDARTKNEWVLTGKDSLFQTFRRALANFESEYTLAKAQAPPTTFFVDGGGDKITLSWDLDNTSGVTGFEVFRARGRFDSTHVKIADLDAGIREFNDTDLERGPAYYYYLTVKGPALQADPFLNIPAVPLRSSRYYTQTYDPSNLKRPAGSDMAQIRVVPNPYNLAADSDNLLFPGEPNKLAFFNIPGDCDIHIYTEMGEMVKTIEHRDGTGDAYWDCTTDSKQIVVSGIYIAAIRNRITGQTKIVKFVIIR